MQINTVENPESQRSIIARDIATCDSELLALENSMNECKSKRSVLLTKMNSVSDSIRGLPLDVVIEIFAILIDSKDPEDVCTLPVPFLLGKICKAWRDIVWNQPSLWTDIRIRISSNRNKYKTQQILLEDWFNNSRHCLLSIFVTSRTGSSGVPYNFAEVILKTASRWKTLKCDGRIFSCIAHTLPRKKTTFAFPNLSRLHIGNKHSRLPSEFRGVPQLQHLLPGNPAKSLLPFHQLTHVTIESKTDSIVSTIEGLKCVQELNLRLPHYFTATSNTRLKAPKLLSHLSNLKIKGQADLVNDILASITVPALSSLDLDFLKVATAVNKWINELKALLDRSSFNLVTFNLRNIQLEEDVTLDFMDSFDASGTISSLSLENVFFFSDMTINRLNPGVGGTNCLLPALTKFHYKGEITLKPSTLTTMLQQRFAVSQTDPVINALTKVDITYRNPQWEYAGEHTDPRHSQAFYRDVAHLASRGITLNIALRNTNSNLDG